MTYCDAGGLGSCAGVGGGVAANTFAAALQFLVHSQCLINEPWPPQATVQNGSSVDVIIVGAGTAGSALAARLAETDLTVLLLEAGDDPPVESIVPGFQEYLLRGQYSWNFTTRKGRKHLPAGRLLGGTGSINHMIYSRSFPGDYDELADVLGDNTWNWENVLPYFKKTERMTTESLVHSSSAKYHGFNGEIKVSRPAELTLETNTFLDAFAELGFKVVEDRNDPENMSPLRAYRNFFTVGDGKRQSSLTSMLNKVATRDNLYVLKNALATKILIKNNTAYGVKVIIDDGEWELYANKEVIVSAGVYNTPKLLMLSGIGPHRFILNTIGTEIVKQLPVGENLKHHVRTFIFLAAESGQLCNRNDTFEAIKYLYDRTGSLAVFSEMGADYSLKSSTNPNLPDFGIFPSCVPKGSDFLKQFLDRFDFTRETSSYLQSINKEYDLFPTCVILRKPKSRGLVTLTSADPRKNPDIYAGTFMEEEDLDGFPEVIEVVKSLVNTTYFKSKNAFVVDLGLEICKGLEWPEDIKCSVKNMAKLENHAVGTAAMGKVLDSRMRVLDISGLRVVDASAIPSTLRSGINAAVIMLAEKAADFITEEHGLIHQHHHHHGNHSHHAQHDHHSHQDHHGNHSHNGNYGNHNHNENHDHHENHDGNRNHDQHIQEKQDHHDDHNQDEHYNEHIYVIPTKNDLLYGKIPNI